MDLVTQLIDRLQIEFIKKDKSGVYGLTQKLLSYNSNRIEGSTFTPEQTSLLFDLGTIASDGSIIRSKDIEEMNGHFAMFNRMLETYDWELSEDLIKNYHYLLKVGVFEDRANGYPCGEYKNRANTVGNIKTSSPKEVGKDIQQLLKDYSSEKNIGLLELAELHARYETIHPFQDGNGRTGRIILFKECLKNEFFPFVIRDENKTEYYLALYQAQIKDNFTPLIQLFEKEQEFYKATVEEFIKEETLEL